MSDKLGIERVIDVDRGTYSRYFGEAYILHDKGYAHSFKELVNLEAMDTDKLFRVTSGFEDVRWISAKFYGDMRLFWAISSVNGIDPNKDIKVGTVVRIPTLDSLYSRGVLV